MITDGQSAGGSRGCGSRVKGGVYLCTGLSKHGSPIEAFLIDPVPPFKGEPFRAPILMEDPQQNGIYHAVVWVGAEFYPSLVDYVEETRVKGASRRIPSGFDFSKLTPGKSRMIFVHPRAFTAQCHVPVTPCPKGIPDHGRDEPCIMAHWEYAQSAGSTVDAGYGVVGDTRYLLPPQDDAPRTLSPGFFMALPITHIEYESRDAQDDGPKSIHQASDLGFDVVVMRDGGDS
ncbi:hypothetical protein [Acidithiobacillus ferridurans]|uniref:Uncharacterized protein n=1 Tax=Acidithiobacillus ferridurans TaxID=1232575 RepID=A0A8X8G5A1_ACIFI|nr:hypothetical protein [Acidithiobacillus ferridurans]MBU2715604.1 hypothetical protein [Acidithiobacillus ferridurans]MBU2722906.1 hypothetical protein [Acidithiobacillus ferridurans]MBU2728202.1 hypothetical protein [Acidithiobacillus ferridurans]